MRSALTAAALAVTAAILSAAPSQAQGGFMWCSATAGNGVDSTVYYSAVFAASPGEAGAKAAAFKEEAAEAEASAASITSRCFASASQGEAAAARAAAMQRTPGEALDWPG